MTSWRVREAWRSWKMHGLPRCTAMTEYNGRLCWGLIWPWHATRGDGEYLYHRRCLDRQDKLLQHFEADA